MPDIQSYLQGLNIPKADKADAWDAFHSTDRDSFIATVGKLNLPKNVKADMYDMRFGGASSAPSSPSAPAVPAPAPSADESNQATLGGLLKSVGHDIWHGLRAPGPTVNNWDDFKKAVESPIAPVSSSETYNYIVNQTPQGAPLEAEKHLVQFGEGLTSPENVALATALGPMAGAVGDVAGKGAQILGKEAAPIAKAVTSGISRAAGGYFAVEGLKGGAQAAGRVYKDVKTGAPVTGDATDALLNTVMGGAGAFHAATGGAHEAPQTPEAIPVEAPMPQATPEAPTAASQTDPVHFPSQSAQEQFAVLKQYLNDQYKQPITPANEQPLANGGGVIKPRQLALPGTVADLSAKGEDLPPQTAEAAPMSPEAEAVSKAAQDAAQNPLGNNTPLSGKADTPQPVERGSAPSAVSQIEASMRPQIGQVLRLQQLLDSDETHDALRRGVLGANGINGLLSDEDRALISHAIGEDVGTTLTPDQKQSALSAAGLVEGERNPKFLNTQKLSGITRATLDQHRDEMATEMANTEDPERRAKLAAALGATDAKGRPQPVQFVSALQGIDTVDTPDDHHMAPFSDESFAQTYPAITLENQRSVLGSKLARNKDLGMLSPDEKEAFASRKAAVAPESQAASFNENTSGMSVDQDSYRKGSDSNAAAVLTDRDRLTVHSDPDDLEGWCSGQGQLAVALPVPPGAAHGSRG